MCIDKGVTEHSVIVIYLLCDGLIWMAFPTREKVIYLIYLEIIANSLEQLTTHPKFHKPQNNFYRDPHLASTCSPIGRFAPPSGSVSTPFRRRATSESVHTWERVFVADPSIRHVRSNGAPPTEA